VELGGPKEQCIRWGPDPVHVTVRVSVRIGVRVVILEGPDTASNTKNGHMSWMGSRTACTRPRPVVFEAKARPVVFGAVANASDHENACRCTVKAKLVFLRCHGRGQHSFSIIIIIHTVTES